MSWMQAARDAFIASAAFTTMLLAVFTLERHQ